MFMMKLKMRNMILYMIMMVASLSCNSLLAKEYLIVQGGRATEAYWQEFEPGDVLGIEDQKYSVLYLLGSGGTTAIYKVKNTTTGAITALRLEHPINRDTESIIGFVKGHEILTNGGAPVVSMLDHSPYHANVAVLDIVMNLHEFVRYLPFLDPQLVNEVVEAMKKFISLSPGLVDLADAKLDAFAYTARKEILIVDVRHKWGGDTVSRTGFSDNLVESHILLGSFRYWMKNKIRDEVTSDDQILNRLENIYNQLLDHLVEVRAGMSSGEVDRKQLRARIDLKVDATGKGTFRLWVIHKYLGILRSNGVAATQVNAIIQEIVTYQIEREVGGGGFTEVVRNIKPHETANITEKVVQLYWTWFMNTLEAGNYGRADWILESIIEIERTARGWRPLGHRLNRAQSQAVLKLFKWNVEQGRVWRWYPNEGFHYSLQHFMATVRLEVSIENEFADYIAQQVTKFFRWKNNRRALLLAWGFRVPNRTTYMKLHPVLLRMLNEPIWDLEAGGLPDRIALTMVFLAHSRGYIDRTQLDKAFKKAGKLEFESAFLNRLVSFQLGDCDRLHSAESM